MNMQLELSSRGKFEAWAATNGYAIGDDHWLAREGDGYYNVTMQLMWEAWQTCESNREPFVVKLPLSISVQISDGLHADFMLNSEIKAAITAAGGRCV